jgi:2-polyprenyl-6-hydroxyphenyl methylase/3-demethylubiquinone-9 3-methyltransferase
MNDVRVPYFLEHGILTKVGHKPIIADIGCGGGLVTETVAKLVPQASVIGIDISENSIKVARDHAKGIQNIQYQIGSIYEIPLNNSSVDLVIVSDVLEHLENPEMAISEIYRILKPNGIVVFDTIARTWWSFLSTYLVAQEILGLVERHAHDWFMFINPTELEAMLIQAGFRTNIGEWKGIVGNFDISNAVKTRNFYNLISSFTISDDDLTSSYMGYAIKP